MILGKGGDFGKVLGLGSGVILGKGGDFEKRTKMSGRSETTEGYTCIGLVSNHLTLFIRNSNILGY